MFPAAYLTELEKRFLGGASIANHFDMIAGTSTGGIITLTLGKSMTAQEALSIDGGIWANNLSMNVLVDALACFDAARENVRILSIGTGEATFALSEATQTGGKKDWAILLPFLAASRAQSKNALGQAFLLAGKVNIVRIDVPESDNPIALDDVTRSLRELPLVARSLVEGSGQKGVIGSDGRFGSLRDLHRRLARLIER